MELDSIDAPRVHNEKDPVHMRCAEANAVDRRSEVLRFWGSEDM